jgi:Arc/MetJ-type ribon-helix-helix transcriptional regulator
LGQGNRAMDLSGTPEKKPEGARAPKQDPALRAFSPQGSHPEGQFTPPASTRRRFLGKLAKARISEGLDRDVDDIVQNLDLWSSRADFFRDAIRRLRNRWIDEARGVKEELDKGSQDLRRSNDPGQEEGEAT